MLSLLSRHGVIASKTPTTVSYLEPNDEEHLVAQKALREDNVVIPFAIGSDKFKTRRTKRSVERLKLFSESVLPSRAINVIRNGISSLEWAIQPKGNLKQEERDAFAGSIKMVRNVLGHPNNADVDFGTFIGQIVEDMLVFDAGCWEYIENPENIEDNNVLAMLPVAGYTVAQSIRWDGNPESIRWQQTIGSKPKFRDDELEFIIQRKRSHTMFGYSQLETTVEIMEAWLGLASYQRNVASNAYPAIMLYLGDQVTTEQAEAMRAYWAVEIEGRGRPGIWGNTGDPKVLNLKPAGDEGLYLKYQEQLVRILALAFGLKPQDFGLERDVNRCYDEKTEVLTALGWKSHDQLLDSDLIATVNPETKCLEYQCPDRIYKYKYSGDMVHIENSLSDVLVTPNHNIFADKVFKRKRNFLRSPISLLVRDNATVTVGPSLDYLEESNSPAIGHYKKTQFIRADRLSEVGRFDELKAVNGFRPVIPIKFSHITISKVEYHKRTPWNEEGFNYEIPIDVMLKFLGYYIAEGGMGRIPAEITQKYGFFLSQNRGPIADDMRMIINKMPCRVREDLSGETVRWWCSGKSMYSFLRSEVGGFTEKKRIPVWVRNLSKNKLGILFRILMDGDGSWDKRENRTSGYYTTCSKQLADDFQEISIKLGYRASISFNGKERLAHHKGLYRICISKVKKATVCKNHIKSVPYDGIVWCVEVPPNHLFITRRNGKVAIHGNSTAVVAQFASVEEARKPVASLLAKRVNCRIIPRISKITGDEMMKELEFFWKGIDPRNRKIDSEIHDVYLKHDVLSIDDVRKDLDLAPLPFGIGKLTPSALKALFKLEPKALIEGTDEPIDQDSIDKLAARIVQAIKKGDLVLSE